ncbi:MAG: FecR domain-containing protein [Bacteroidota bacterium]
MEDNSEIKRLLLKFVEGDCTQQEIDQVVRYFQAAKMTEDFPTTYDVLELIDDIPKVDEAVSQRIVQNILTKDRRKKASKRPVWKYASIAALFIGLIGLGIFYQQGGLSTKVDMVVPGNDAITLELDNGEIKIIDENGSETIATASGQVVGQQEKNKLTYEGSETTGELVYNTLTVPYGKRFDIELSDGTTVFLNAGSSIKYPVNFVKGMERQVFLTGEAFLEVTKDTKHPFIVNADELNVQVLGTQFNVSNYPEDKRAEVVLVEGSVGMYQDHEDFDESTNMVLTPGLKGTFDESTQQIETKEVSTKVYTAWVGGELVFRNMTFGNILKKLERAYNVTINNTNTELGRKTFNASFKEGDINMVLQSFQKYYGIEYSIENNEVNIN